MRPVLRIVEYAADQAMVLGAIVLMLGAAWLPLTGQLPGLAFQTLASLAAVFAFAGGLVIGRGSRPAFVLLWASAGLTIAFGTLGLGRVYLIAALMIIHATTGTPSRTRLRSGLDRCFVMVLAEVGSTCGSP